mmetsp:Transcript_9314/g.18176  ORF Transcript_9314/g.18176 Transcript_9314/m.18176 type:complete len:141 (-) Transcript_9314:155-577(-)
MDTAHVHLRSSLEEIKWKCFNSDCTFKGTKRQLEDHLDLECQEQQQKCQYEGCEKRRRRASIADHERECTARPIPCDHCTEIFPRQSMVQHLTVCKKVSKGLREEPSERCSIRPSGDRMLRARSSVRDTGVWSAGEEEGN